MIMLLTMLLALQQESVMPPPPRFALPRPVANAPLARVNDNRRPAGTRSGNTLTLALDIVEAAYQPEGEHDPIVRAFAFAEPGSAPTIPGPLIRGPLGTVVKLTLRNRTDSVLKVGGLGHHPGTDTVYLAVGASREVTFTLDKVGNYFYWAGQASLDGFADRYWLDAELTGALVVDAPGAT